MKRLKKYKLLVFIVAYNAEKTIRWVLGRIPEKLLNDYFIENLFEFDFSRNGSNYSLYRHLSKKCQDVMGYSQTNKWVMDQIIDIDSVEILKKILEVYDSVTKS